MFSLIVAMDKNRVIGLNNGMPWHLPKDLQYFKERTSGHTIIMGRKTFESLGRVLPNRKHIVLTRSNQSFPEGVELVSTIEEIIQYKRNRPEEQMFIIGGGELFKQMLPYISRMYITKIDEAFEGDVYFPEFQKDEWELVSKEKGPMDDRNPYHYYYLVYERK